MLVPVMCVVGASVVILAVKLVILSGSTLVVLSVVVDVILVAGRNNPALAVME